MLYPNNVIWLCQTIVNDPKLSDCVQCCIFPGHAPHGGHFPSQSISDISTCCFDFVFVFFFHFVQVNPQGKTQQLVLPNDCAKTFTCTMCSVPSQPDRLQLYPTGN
jgi:hypothetical protein